MLSLKTSESWIRQGYKIKEGAQAMKTIKQRAVTVNKKRVVEMALANQNGDGSGEGNEGLMQGLYAKGQTELYIPPTVVNVSSSSLPVLFTLVGSDTNGALGRHPQEQLWEHRPLRPFDVTGRGCPHTPYVSQCYRARFRPPDRGHLT